MQLTVKDEHDSFDSHCFQQYLQGIAGGNRSRETASAIAQDVQLFFASMPQTLSNCYLK